MRPRALPGVLVLLAAGSLASAAEVTGHDDGTNGIDLTLGARAAYEDNLYRLPDGVDPALFLGPGAERDDYLRRLFAGVDGSWQWSRQKLLLDWTVSDNAYEHNDTLDNVAQRGSLEWDWRAGSAWSGALGGDYSSSLASFANTRVLQKDLLDTTGAFARLGFRLGPSWQLKGAMRRATTEHSAAARRFDDSRNESITAGLHYTTSSDNEIGVDVRRSDTNFDRALNLAGQQFDRDYRDEAITLEFLHARPRTSIDASVGYLRREYPDVALVETGKGDFSGIVGDLTVEWEASNKIGLTFNARRRPRAYLDAESDYFLAQGGSVASTWTPTGRLSFSLELDYERQDYLGNSLNLPVEGRNDRVSSGELSMTYYFLRRLRIDLTGRIEERDSNRPLLAYESLVASLGLRWTR